MSADTHVQVIGEKCGKLDSEKSSLCQKATVLFYLRHEVRKLGWIGGYHCLSEQCTNLCATDIEDIACGCKFRQGDARSG